MLFTDGVLQVLQQCPTLEEMYVDAWPVYLYLQLAMKQHALGYGYKMVPGLSTSTDVRRISLSLKLRSTYIPDIFVVVVQTCDYGA